MDLVDRRRVTHGDEDTILFMLLHVAATTITDARMMQSTL